MSDASDPAWLKRFRGWLNDQVSGVLVKVIGSEVSREKQYVSRNTLFLLGLEAAFLLFAFLISVTIARLYGAEGYGVFSYVFSWVMVVGHLGQLGMGPLLIRQIGRYHRQEKWSLIKGMWSWSLWMGLGGCVLGSMVLGGSVYLFEWLRQPALMYPLLLALLATPFFGLTAINRSSLQGMQRPALGQLSEKLIRPASLLILLITGYWLLPQFNIQHVIGMNVVAFGLMGVGSFILVYWYLPGSMYRSRGKYHRRYWVSAGIAFLLISGLNIIESRTDVLMLGSLDTTESVGVYHIAKRLVGLTGVLLTVVNMTLAPLISDLASQQQWQRLQRILTKTIRGVFLFTLPFGVILMAGGKWFLLIFGSEFTSGWSALVILCFAKLSSIAIGSVAYILSMTGHERVVGYGVGMGVIVNIGLNAILIPYWGVEGAALATLTSNLTWNLLLFYQVRQKTGLRPTIFGK
jgi:O-antigen/teichoic acid export membrane protein